jgi:hypothetical protein
VDSLSQQLLIKHPAITATGFSAKRKKNGGKNEKKKRKSSDRQKSFRYFLSVISFAMSRARTVTLGCS